MAIDWNFSLERSKWAAVSRRRKARVAIEARPLRQKKFAIGLAPVHNFGEKEKKFDDPIVKGLQS